jgi:hypothetical protein
MSMRFVESSGLLEAAKQAAVDAVADYDRINAYTVGIAVQAAAAVLRTGYQPPAALRAREAWDVPSVEVTPRLRALETVAKAAMRDHGIHDEPCGLCDALRELAATA